MKFLIAVFLFSTLSCFGAVPDYKAFRGTGGISIVSNPPTGTITIDGSSVVPGAGTNATISVSTNTTKVAVGSTNVNFIEGWNTFFKGTNIASRSDIQINMKTNLTFDLGDGTSFILGVDTTNHVFGIYNVNQGRWSMVNSNGTGDDWWMPGYITLNALSIRTPQGTGNWLAFGDQNFIVRTNGVSYDEYFLLTGEITNQWGQLDLEITERQVGETNLLYASSNQVRVAAGANVTVTPSGSGGIMTYTVASSGGSGTPGGANFEVQYNSAGSFAGSPNFRFLPSAYQVQFVNPIVPGEIDINGEGFISQGVSGNQGLAFGIGAKTNILITPDGGVFIRPTVRIGTNLFQVEKTNRTIAILVASNGTFQVNTSIAYGGSNTVDSGTWDAPGKTNYANSFDAKEKITVGVGSGTNGSATFYDMSGTKYSRIEAPGSVIDTNTIRLITTTNRGITTMYRDADGVLQMTNVPVGNGQIVTWDSSTATFRASNQVAGATAQSPWAQNIDGGGFSLTNVGAPGGTGTPILHAGTNVENGLTVSTNGRVGIGVSLPLALLHLLPTNSSASYLRIDDTNTTPRFQVGVLPGFSSFGAIWLGQSNAPSVSNYQIASDGGNTTVRGSGNVTLVANTTTTATITTTGVGIGSGVTPLAALHVVGGIVQTNGGIWQTFSVLAPSAPATQGAVYWNDGTNLCAVFRNGAGTLTTNKLTMSAWP